MQFKQTEVLDKVFDQARHFAKRHGDEALTSDHLFWAILEVGCSHAYYILRRLLKEWEITQIKGRIEREFEQIARLPARESQDPASKAFAVETNVMLRMAVELGNTAPRILNTAHLLMAILRDRHAHSARILALYNITPSTAKELSAHLPPSESFYEDVEIIDLQEKKSEEAVAYADRSVGVEKRGELLARFGTDLTQAAEKGRLDPVVGRSEEMERMIQILGRRKKNNPVLIGEPGVGKSAVVEGLALRIVQKQVPPALHNKRIFALDVSSLVAGTKYRGEFEERINELLQELKRSRNTILFIDEIHTIVGMGGTQGALDTANILKPALTRSELQCIGATTLNEYREHIESDGALERRFQKIIVEQPSAEETLEVLRNIKTYYEDHHGVSYTDQALKACVELTERYMSDRFFPDKAIDVMDEAGSRASLLGGGGAGVKPAPGDPSPMGTDRETAPAALAAAAPSAAATITLPASSAIEVDEFQVREVVSCITGVPSSQLSQGERERLRRLHEHFSAVVIGQDEAVRKVTRTLQRSRVGLKDPNRPIGVFMFTGPTGVGKTHMAKELAHHFFDSDDSLVRIDMSEYTEKHNVSRLIGSPPGYVGYGEGGQLTEKVRRHPYCVLLFDEIEKAHPDVFNLMLQIFDDGRLTDGLGRRVDFRNTIIIMTSNVGSREMHQRRGPVGYGTRHTSQLEKESRESTYRKSLERIFAPEFINRIDDIVTFNPLTSDDIKRIVELELGNLAKRLRALGYDIRTTENAKKCLVALGYEPDYGVRSLKRTILNQVEEPLAEMIVEGKVSNGDIVQLDCRNKQIALTVKPTAA